MPAIFALGQDPWKAVLFQNEKQGLENFCAVMMWQPSLDSLSREKFSLVLTPKAIILCVSCLNESLPKVST